MVMTTIKQSFAVTVLIIISMSFAKAGVIDFEDKFTIGDGLLEPGDIVSGATLFGATFSVVNQGNAWDRKQGVKSGYGLPMNGSIGTRELMLFNSDCNALGYHIVQAKILIYRCQVRVIF